jgi:pyridoxal 5'-phosphate synthase pdxT subunit
VTGRIPPNIGVLALQGDVREHLRALERVGGRGTPVRRPGELADCAGLILPGGESTTMIKLATTFELLEPLRSAIQSGMPAYGSCAGMILLADRLVDAPPGQPTIGGLDISVRRNAFGRQVDSFETDLDFHGLDGAPVHAVFIRAPWVETAGPAVEVLARVDAAADSPAAGRIVAARQGHLLATSFHPELTGDARVHALFVEMVEQASKGR